MAIVYLWWMVIVLNSKKGFSMPEMLVCMCIICALMLLSINSTNKLNLDNYYFLNDYLYNQSLAILNKEKIFLDHGVSFNEMGHVNQARTIKFENHSIIVHLGNGYATQE